ncbi:acetyl-CoA carboxylase carboxyltransferase subunit alpha [Candidatus Margulisiibacteriota bacterium]
MKDLEFEKPIIDLYTKIEQLKQLSEESDINLSTEISNIESRAEKLQKEIYSNLSPVQIVKLARHPDRPDSLSLFNLIFDEFVELHGDRCFRDDPAIIGGLAMLKKQGFIAIGHQKGHETKENIYRNFGMPNPEGYRKALRLMEMAEKFNLPIITFIDTPGAFPGIEAEERGQAEAIARNLREMMALTVPIITVVIGEGGSGGALGIGIANKVYMLEYSFYSVISPEGCASILFHDALKANLAADNMKITAQDILKLGIADDIIKEPIGGSHKNWEETAANIKKVILKDIAYYSGKNKDKICEERYKKYRAIGTFV